ncbi:FAD-dependent oxidoreductase [Mesorhizobium australicum]
MARAAIEASLLLRHRSIAGNVAFRREIDHSRHVIAQSRELLKRLRQRQRDDNRPAWEDTDPVPISAFDADILRAVFRDLVSEANVPECQWRDLAKSLVHEFTGCELVETGLIEWLIHK